MLQQNSGGATDRSRRNMGTDHYRILGVREDAPDEEIKRQYRSLAKRYHPDGHPDDPEAEKRFREVTEAYRVLGDKERRRAYDQERTRERETAGAPGKKGKSGHREEKKQARAGFDPNDMSAQFEQFFGFQPRGGQVRKEKLDPKGKTRTDPIDMTEMFERYMGIKWEGKEKKR